MTNLREALLQLARTAEGRQDALAIFHADGFVAAADSDYAPLRR